MTLLNACTIVQDAINKCLHQWSPVRQPLHRVYHLAQTGGGPGPDNTWLLDIVAVCLMAWAFLGWMYVTESPLLARAVNWLWFKVLRRG